MITITDRSKRNCIQVDVTFGNESRIVVSLWMEDHTTWGDVIVTLPRIATETRDLPELWEALDAARIITDEFMAFSGKFWLPDDHKAIVQRALHRVKEAEAFDAQNSS